MRYRSAMSVVVDLNYASIDSILFPPSSSVATTEPSTNVKTVWSGLTIGFDVTVDDQPTSSWRLSTGNSSDMMSRLAGPSDSALVFLTSSDHIEHHLATWLWIYLSPVLLVLGTCGNIMSLVVLRGCPSFRKSSVAFTLSALAVVDTGVLYTSLLRQWLIYLTDSNVELRSAGGLFGCRLHFFLTYYLSQLSSWTVIVVTVERSLFVGLPMLAKTICSRSRIMLIWSLIATSLFFLNSHFFFIAWYPMTAAVTPEYFSASNDDFGNVTMNDETSTTTTFPISATLLTEYNSFSHSDDLKNQTANYTEGQEISGSSPEELETLICYISTEHLWFFSNVWYWIDFVVLSAVPFIVIVTGNGVIAVCVIRAVHFRRQHQRRLTARASGLLQSASPTRLCERQQTVNSEITSCGGGGSHKWKSSNDRYRTTLTSSTLMLASVSVSFLLTTAPNVVYFLLVDGWLLAADQEPDREKSSRQEARIFLGFAITNLLYYTNNSINFLLYCLTGTRFRRAARDLIKPKRPSTQSGAAHDFAPGIAGGRKLLRPVANPTGSRNTAGGANRRLVGESSISAMGPTSPSAATAHDKPGFVFAPHAIVNNGVWKPTGDNENVEIQ